MDLEVGDKIEFNKISAYPEYDYFNKNKYRLDETYYSMPGSIYSLLIINGSLLMEDNIGTIRHIIDHEYDQLYIISWKAAGQSFETQLGFRRGSFERIKPLITLENLYKQSDI